MNNKELLYIGFCVKGNMKSLEKIKECIVQKGEGYGYDD